MSPEKPGGKKNVVMIVDDEEVIRNMLREFLVKSGYQVVLASGGLEAIEKFKQADGRFDLVLIDMMLPEVDVNGMKVFETIREINPGIKAILTSGYSQNVLEFNSEEGVISFLQKPFRIAELLGKIETLLNQS